MAGELLVLVVQEVLAPNTEFQILCRFPGEARIEPEVGRDVLRPGRHQRAVGDGAHAVAAAAEPLHEPRDAARAADLDDVSGLFVDFTDYAVDWMLTEVDPAARQRPPRIASRVSDEQDPVVIELGDICSFTDYFFICTGTSNRHNQTIAETIEEKLKKEGIRPLHVEGQAE